MHIFTGTETVRTKSWSCTKESYAKKSEYQSHTSPYLLVHFLLHPMKLFEWFHLVLPQAYVQQLETSRLKLAQLEQELDKARKQVSWKSPFFIFVHVTRYICFHIRQNQIGIHRMNPWLPDLQGAYAGNALGTSHMGYNGALNSGLWILDSLNCRKNISLNDLTTYLFSRNF